MAGNGRFDFLGFEYYWERTRNGRLGVKRRTSRKKLHASLANITDWMRRNRSLPVGQLVPVLRAKYSVYWNYYGAINNSPSLAQFFHRSKRILFKWINRRSHRKSYTWTAFQDLLEFFGVEGPKITEQHIPIRPRFL